MLTDAGDQLTEPLLGLAVRSSESAEDLGLRALLAGIPLVLGNLQVGDARAVFVLAVDGTYEV